MTVCDKITSPDDCQHIRESIEEAYDQLEQLREEYREQKEINAEIEKYSHEQMQVNRSNNADFSISGSPDPFKDPVDHYSSNMKEWWTTTGNHIKVWTDRDGQINYEVFSGPDRGVHKYYDPQHQTEGMTGVQDPFNPSVRRHDHDGKK